MKVLYLSFYYEPDLCAGSFRNTPLIKQLAGKLEGKGSVEVFTTYPNRYASFKQEPELFEENENLTVHRIKLPDHNSGFKDQINSFKTYFFSVLKEVKGKEYDLVVASSSRLFTAFLGAYISRKINKPLYLDIRDIFVDTIDDVLKNKIVKAVLLPVLKRIEKYTFGTAKHINLISEGFKGYFSKYKKATYSYYSNGIDQEFLSIRTQEEKPDGTRTIVYAGNFGEGQGLDKIIPQLAKELGSKFQFRLIGDGGQKASLLNELQRLNLKNVKIQTPIKRAELIQVYQKADYLFLHLNDYQAFEKVLPSKLFEYGATDKPIIAGVAGYAAQFVQKNLVNAVLFNPGDYKAAAEKILNTPYEVKIRNEFIDQFKRVNINSKIVDSITGTL